MFWRRNKILTNINTLAALLETAFYIGTDRFVLEPFPNM
jgi:hypothetical protein